jgi:hypothetical protein
MTNPKPYPRCIFCGARANSREHAVPAWISKRLGIREFLAPETAIIHGVTRRRQPISFASHRARIFCKTCNTHFKHLEDAVIPLVIPMARGRVLSLGAEHQELLALWSSKTGAALLAATAPELHDAVPGEHRMSIQIDGRPHGDSWCGWFSWSGDALIAAGTGVAVGATAQYDTYLSILAFAKIGFVVTGFMQPVSSQDTLDIDKPSLVRLWPPVPRYVHWPPIGPPLRPGGDVATLLATVPLRRRAA